MSAGAPIVDGRETPGTTLSDRVIWRIPGEEFS